MTKWEFNENVTNCFEEMLSRSIPSYERLRTLIKDISINHINSNGLMHTNVLDLGSSHGEQIRILADHLHSNRFYGLEVSKPMLKYSRKKLKDYPNVEIMNMDISKQELPVTQCGLILSIFTLHFIQIEYRQRILNNIYNSLHKNGIFIFCEKIIGDNYIFSEIYEKEYYNMKQINGYSLGEIRDKKLKLEGVLVPVTNEFNIGLLKQAGFTKVDIFFKDLNFIGYIAMK